MPAVRAARSVTTIAFIVHLLVCGVGLRETRDRIAGRFEEQDDLLAVDGPGSVEPHAHPSAQRLDVQQSFRQRFGHEESADHSR
jgi:hypothetical protein